jgi:di/tricarboxylate transporter
MTTIIENAGMTFEMMFLFSLIVGALFCYANEKIPMEITALGVVLILLFFFHFFPIIDQEGSNLLPSSKILSGFANPAMLTVLALLVVGQGVVKTGILEIFSRYVLALSMGKLWIATLISLITVLLISAFLNNIPVVIIFIPIMQGIAQRFHIPASKLLMPLSFVAVVGGMTTLVGSGTNLLVSNALIEAGFEGFTFFEFTLPGLLLAGTGLAYVTIVAPKFLPHRTSLSHRMRERLDQHFMAEISINAGSRLIGQSLGVRMFHELPDINVRMINRLGKTILPPFTGLKLREGDVIALSAARDDLTKLMDSGYGLIPAEGYRTNPNSHKKSDQIVVEMMVTPSSSLVDNTIGRTGFEYRHNCQVMGIQHHAHMIRSRMGQAKLAAGDLLLVKCDTETLRGLREDLDVVLVEFSVEELPNLKSAHVSIFIFLSVVLSAAFGLVPIVISSFFGALAMVVTNVITLQQAARALDLKVITTIAAALALGVAMEATGAATYLANLILSFTGTASPRVVLSTFFLMVALMSNIISTKTCAVLFAPIGLHIGAEIGIDPRIFAITIVFAANCAFATPFAYQTSLLVMGPGSYHFKDFLKVGSPLVILIWLVYSAFIPWYYGL